MNMRQIPDSQSLKYLLWYFTEKCLPTLALYDIFSPPEVMNAFAQCLGRHNEAWYFALTKSI